MQWLQRKKSNIISVRFYLLKLLQQDQVSINGIPNYEMPQRFVEEEFKLLDDNEDEDEDASENDENDEFDLSTDTISCWAVIMIWSNFIASFFITRV